MSAPALTAEQWALPPQDVLDGYISFEDGVIDVRLGGPAGMASIPNDAHVLMAYCNEYMRQDKNPNAFTHEDVELLEMFARGDPQGHIRAECASLAARIAALLPPAE